MADQTNDCGNEWTLARPANQDRHAHMERNAPGSLPWCRGDNAGEDVLPTGSRREPFHGGRRRGIVNADSNGRHRAIGPRDGLLSLFVLFLITFVMFTTVVVVLIVLGQNLTVVVGVPAVLSGTVVAALRGIAALARRRRFDSDANGIVTGPNQRR